ncbi:MAG: hypothetical protein R3F23_06710 [Verrucomicrobiia bacterium]
MKYFKINVDKLCLFAFITQNLDKKQNNSEVKTIMKKYILTLALSLGLMGSAFAQLSITTFGATNTIDFENTIPGVNNGPFRGLGFEPSPVAGELDSDAWAVNGNFSDGDLPFGGTENTVPSDCARGAVINAVTTGGIYAYTNGITNFLMVQLTGSEFNPGTIKLRIQNNSGGIITNLNVSYKVALRNDQPGDNTFKFSHSPDDMTYTSEPTLMLLRLQ